MGLHRGNIMQTRKRAAELTLFTLIFLTCTARAGDVNGKISTSGLKSASNIAVYVDTIPGQKFDPPATHPKVDQRNLKFIPQTIVILRGTTVDFLNSDHVAHNVYWPSVNGNKALKHSLTVVSPGQTKSYQFNDLGEAPILCNLHVEMVGHVIVVPTPYFALTDMDGGFTIKNVPPGTYTLKTWSEDGKVATQKITVTDAVTNVQLTVSK